MGSRNTANATGGSDSHGPGQPSPAQPEQGPQNHAQRLLQQVLRRAANTGQALWPLLARRRAGIEQLVRGLPERLRRTANQISLTLELADDYRSGAYRDIPWTSIAVAIAGVIYVVSPVDLVPIPIPTLGGLDDAVVMGLVMRYLRPDLTRYCHFKGYDPADYFD